jgi:RHS repeat-associated protein
MRLICLVASVSSLCNANFDRVRVGISLRPSVLLLKGVPVPRACRSPLLVISLAITASLLLGLGGARPALGMHNAARAGAPDNPRHVSRVVLSVVAFAHHFDSGRGGSVQGTRRAAGNHASVSRSARTLASYSQCPQVGQSASCGVLVTIGDSGTTVQTDSSVPPLDGIEDTLIGVQNNSSGTIGSLQLSSNTDLFGFDGDGLCVVSPHPSGCPFGSTGYEGPGATFSNINPSSTGGIVNFTGGLAPGASAYFALEEALTGAMIVTGGPTTSEQGGPPNLAEKPVTISTGCPVNCATGVFWHQWNDLSVPGRGVPLDFQRTYSSGAAAADGPLGFGWTDNYNMSLSVDQSGNITVNQEDGSTVLFSSGSGGYVAAPRVLATLVKNSDGTYTFTRNADLVHYTFSATGQLLKAVDRNGYTTTLSYSGSQLSSVTDPVGRSFSFSYSGSHISSITGPGPRTESFTYDSSGNLATATDAISGVWTFTYDANHRLLTMKDPRNGVITNVYDSSARVTSQTDPMNRTTTWSYTGNPASPAGGTTTVTSPNGNVTVMSFQNLELLSQTEASGTSLAATTSFVYDPATLGVTSLTDPNNHTSTALYDSGGNQTSFTDPVNRQTSSTYNNLNEPLIVTDPSGIATTRTYDASGNLLTTSRPLNGTQTQSVTYHYADSSHPGDLTSLTDPNGHTTSFSYDGQGDLASVIDPLGDTSTFSYNTLGERTSMVSPRGNVTGGTPSQYTTSYVYDALSRVTSTTDPLGHSSSRAYDGDSNVTSSTDGKNNTTSYTYDADNELTKITRADTTTLQYGYDGDGNQMSQADGAGHTTSYGFDRLDRVSSMVDPLNRTTGYGYDAAGNLTSLTNPAGQQTSFGYDNANERTSISYSDPNTPNVSFTYTANGLRATMTDGTGTPTSYSYDQLDRLTGQTNGAGQTVAYGYDLNGNLTSLTYPNSQTVSRSYDNANRLTGITDWLNHITTVTVDPDSNTTAIAYPNGVAAATAFDQADQLSSITDKNGGGTTIAGFSYTRDNNGQLASTTPTGTGQGGNEAYTYNSLNKLTGVNSSTYTYNAADNVTALVSGATLSYDNANQLTSSTLSGTSTSYSYDSSGNRTGATTNPQLTVSGNEITDAVRSAGVQGDGRAAPDSSTGVWQATTNIAANSGPFVNANLIGSFNSTLAYDTSVATKFGNALKVTPTSSTAATTSAGWGAATGSVSGATAGRIYSCSIWVYVPAALVGKTFTLYCRELGGATGFSDTRTTYTAVAGWQRMTGSRTVVQNDRNNIQAIVSAPLATSDGSYWAAAAQIEQLRVATPYIPTANSGTATSSRPVAAVQAPATLLSTSQGWVALRVRAEWSSATPPGGGSSSESMFDWRTDSNNRYSLTWDETAKKFSFVRSIAGTSTTALGPLQTINPGDLHTVIAKWVNATSIAISIDGGAFTTTTITGSFTPSLTNFALGNNSPSNTNPLDGEILWAAAGTGTLANADATTLNNFGNTDPTISQLPGTPTFAWNANTASYQGGGTTATYAYDRANRLTSSATTSGTTNYSYDGDGLRSAATNNGTTQHFAWDLSGGPPLLLTDGSTSYLYDDAGLPIEQIDSAGTALYYQHDQLGSTRLLTNQAGATAATYTYDAYGNLTSHTGTSDTPLRWNGQYQDNTSGLYYLRARYYDPASAQLLTRDPLVDITQQPYGYADANPLNSDDPTGLCAASSPLPCPRSYYGVYTGTFEPLFKVQMRVLNSTSDAIQYNFSFAYRPFWRLDAEETNASAYGTDTNNKYRRLQYNSSYDRRFRRAPQIKPWYAHFKFWVKRNTVLTIRAETQFVVPFQRPNGEQWVGDNYLLVCRVPSPR